MTGYVWLKRQKLTTHSKKIANHSKIQYEGSTLLPYPHQNIFWREYLHGSILHSILGCVGGVGGMCNQKGDKWPPIGNNLQITHKSIMKALFCSCTHTKTYFEENISRGVFHTVFWGYGMGMWVQKGKKWPPTGKKLQITQKSNMKALYCSHTHIKTYFEKQSPEEYFL